MARLSLSPKLDAIVAFEDAGVRLPRRRRRKGDGRRQRLRRIAGEVKRDEVWRLRHATFAVAEGESVAIVGGKGSGARRSSAWPRARSSPTRAPCDVGSP